MAPRTRVDASYLPKENALEHGGFVTPTKPRRGFSCNFDHRLALHNVAKNPARLDNAVKTTVLRHDRASRKINRKLIVCHIDIWFMWRYIQIIEEQEETTEADVIDQTETAAPDRTESPPR
jgi:hypothetical protein